MEDQTNQSAPVSPPSPPSPPTATSNVASGPSPVSGGPKPLLIGVVLIGILAVGAFFLMTRSKTPAPQTGSTTLPQNQSSPTVAVAAGKGKLMLRVAEGQTAVVGTPLKLNVVADSDGKSVTGYDLILKYDQELLTYDANASLLPDFQVVSRKDADKVTLIGFKQLSVTAPQVFANTPVMEVTFTPKKAGSAEFSIEFTPNATTDSNIMIEAVQPTDILGSVEGATVTIQ